ncbi:hypothetical protein BB560_002045 [Smittium megazygosporum]|uniref:Profilin n=1 Tax=Smittium megazygosporum TaxID=133381 RepID=A0A2T9ZFT8_9FUNG|nr:hypothetical protein BB560_002045 [Smittium megazygosporum]
MSWQAYVDSNLVGSGFVKSAAIYGLDGSLWASSGTNAQPEEIQKIIKGFADSGPLLQSGLFFGGEKFIAVNCSDRSIYGRREGAGIACAKTKLCVLIGIYDESVQPGQAISTVERLAEYLVSVGY